LGVRTPVTPAALTHMLLVLNKWTIFRAAVGMGIPMGIPMGMGMVWVWGL